MNKVLITVIVPKIEKTYDIFVPANKKISTLCELLCKSINELSDGSFVIQDSVMVLNELGVPYDWNKNIKDSGIKNGSKIILL